MKRNVLLLFLWVLGLVANISCTSKPSGKTKFQDSIVVFFRPIYSSKIVGAKKIIMMSDKVPVLDTLFVDNRDYDSIKNFIENRKKIRAKIKGVPEVYLKACSKNSPQRFNCCSLFCSLLSFCFYLASFAFSFSRIVH